MAAVGPLQLLVHEQFMRSMGLLWKISFSSCAFHNSIMLFITLFRSMSTVMMWWTGSVGKNVTMMSFVPIIHTNAVHKTALQ